MGIPEVLGTIGGIPAPSTIKSRSITPERPSGGVINAGADPEEPNKAVPDEPVG